MEADGNATTWPSESSHRSLVSMKTLALIALSLSICINLTGRISPFRVKAREYATADTPPTEERDTPVLSAPRR